jgi:hypothetical protein
MPWITSPEILELICRFFEPFEPKVADTDQIFGLGSQFPAGVFLKKGLRSLKCLWIPTKLIEGVRGPKKGRFSNGKGRSFFVDLMKELIPIVIGAVFESNPSTGIEGIAIEFTFWIFFNYVVKI